MCLETRPGEEVREQGRNLGWGPVLVGMGCLRTAVGQWQETPAEEGTVVQRGPEGRAGRAASGKPTASTPRGSRETGSAEAGVGGRRWSGRREESVPVVRERGRAPEPVGGCRGTEVEKGCVGKRQRRLLMVPAAG